MADFTIKRGDTRPVLAATLTDNGVPIDLTTATAVKLMMRQQGSQVVLVNSDCGFVDRDEGKVSYQWVTQDTAGVGLFDAEFQITWNDGGIETVPNDVPTGASAPYYVIEIKADIA